MTMHSDELKIGIGQIAPVWLDRAATLARVEARVREAADAGCALVAFGEALVPGYPFWLSITGGAAFDSPRQRAIHSRYLQEAVVIEEGHLQGVQALAAQHGLSVVLGVVERAPDRGGHSLYCSLVTIDSAGAIASVHRKLVPTYEERLCWAPGDGNGLRTHRLGAFTLGSLNCWENWLPLARTALYAQGEDLHVAAWPGSLRNTQDITRFIAREARSFVVSASSLIRREDIPSGFPEYEAVLQSAPEVMADGGSCIAGPDGSWVLEPVTHDERLLCAVIDHGQVREQRQSLDGVGHYSRPDVTRLLVNTERQRLADFREGSVGEADADPRV